MKRLKSLLKEYLQLRQGILNSNLVKEREKIRQRRPDKVLPGKELLIVNTDDVALDGIRLDDATRGGIDQNDVIGMAYRDELGAVYDRLWWELGAYDGGITLFKHGRGRKRLNQVKRVRELVEADNRLCWQVML